LKTWKNAKTFPKQKIISQNRGHMMSLSTTWNDLIYPGNADDFFARQSFPAFCPDATGYSRDNARWLMELCRLVYRHDIEETDHPPQPTRNSFLTNAGFRQRKFVHTYQCSNLPRG